MRKSGEVSQRPPKWSRRRDGFLESAPKAPVPGLLSARFSHQVSTSFWQ